MELPQAHRLQQRYRRRRLRRLPLPLVAGRGVGGFLHLIFWCYQAVAAPGVGLVANYCTDRMVMMTSWPTSVDAMVSCYLAASAHTSDTLQLTLQVVGPPANILDPTCILARVFT